MSIYHDYIDIPYQINIINILTYQANIKKYKSNSLYQNTTTSLTYNHYIIITKIKQYISIQCYYIDIEIILCQHTMIISIYHNNIYIINKLIYRDNINICRSNIIYQHILTILIYHNQISINELKHSISTSYFYINIPIILYRHTMSILTYHTKLISLIY